jgi:fructan beta-fructosidase
MHSTNGMNSRSLLQLSRRGFLAAGSAAFAFGQTTRPLPEEVNLTPEAVADEQNYDQPLRPQFHYTPIQGDLNDATGLIYYRGEYHLFHMYDEWSRIRAAHKRWGHAISTDLVHWQQLPAVLDTLIDNMPGSGCGVVDWNNSSGLRVGPEKTLLIFYTDYKRGTCMARSHDRGRTWSRYGGNPVIAGAQDARDPLIFWYKPAGEWRMVRYERQGFAFYKSTDLLHWTWLSRLEGYFECPDFFELPIVDKPGEHRWVLVDGNGTYQVGTFDGEQFSPQTGKLHVEYGKALYATQTWKRTIEGGAVCQMAWMRQPLKPPLTWNGQMCFPVELTLRSFPEGIRLCRQPIDEINNLSISRQTWHDLTIGPVVAKDPAIRVDLLDIRLEIEPGAATDFGLIVRGQPVRYSVPQQTLTVGSDSAPLILADRRLRLRILVDRPSIEVFADEGQVTISAVYLEGNTNQDIRLVAAGGNMRVNSLVVSRLESIWLGNGITSKPAEAMQ